MTNKMPSENEEDLFKFEVGKLICTKSDLFDVGLRLGFVARVLEATAHDYRKEKVSFCLFKILCKYQNANGFEKLVNKLDEIFQEFDYHDYLEIKENILGMVTEQE